MPCKVIMLVSSRKASALEQHVCSVLSSALLRLPWSSPQHTNRSMVVRAPECLSSDAGLLRAAPSGSWRKRKTAAPVFEVDGGCAPRRVLRPHRSSSRCAEHHRPLLLALSSLWVGQASRFSRRAASEAGGAASIR